MDSEYSWINETYIAECLRKSPKEIVDFKIKPAVGKGDNYASKLIRVEVETKEEIKNNLQNILLKCLPDGIMKTILQDAGLWDKEMYMYKTVLPTIEKYVGQQIGPKCLNSLNVFNNNAKNDKVIVLEDLSYNYKMADRVEQLDFDHCCMVMKTIAKFHAGSIAVKRNYKKDIDYVGEELCFKETRRDVNENYLTQPFKCLANDLKRNNELKKYSNNLEKFSDKFWDLSLMATKPNQFNVLNHGDLWTNNILFYYDELTGDVKDARLVDFQCCRYTTPAFDLQHFFMSSVKEEIRETKLQELVDIYINCLNKELIKLGERTMSKQQLDKDLLRMDCYGLYTALSILPVSLRDPDDVNDEEDISNINAESNPFLKCIRGDKFQNLLPNILKYFDKKGLFEDDYDIGLLDKFDVEQEINDNLLI